MVRELKWAVGSSGFGEIVSKLSSSMRLFATSRKTYFEDLLFPGESYHQVLLSYVKPIFEYTASDLYCTSENMVFYIELNPAQTGFSKLLWHEPCSYTIRRLILACDLCSSEASMLHDFLTVFGGFHYWIKSPMEFRLFEDSSIASLCKLHNDSFDGNIDGFEVWVDAIILYYSLSGDCLLFKGGVGFGWWFVAELRIGMICESILEFVHFFGVRFRRQAMFSPYD